VLIPWRFGEEPVLIPRRYGEEPVLIPWRYGEEPVLIPWRYGDPSPFSHKCPLWDGGSSMCEPLQHLVV